MLEEKDLKKDIGKARWDLLPIPAMQEVVAIYTFGAKKYEANSWKAGMAYSRVYAALLRHVTSWWQGETYDKESGLHHLAHAAWNCLTLLTYDLYGKTKHDDRPCDMIEKEPK